MSLKYDATVAALERYDGVDGSDVELACRTRGDWVDLSGFTDARKVAADRVRAAFYRDARAFMSEEQVGLMSVERIRRALGPTLAGKFLGLLP
jgi:hypothetical protein